MAKYDSTKDTLEHIAQVQKALRAVCKELVKRGIKHDKSKLESPEKDIFDEYTPKLKETTYNSAEYKQHLKDMQKGLDHHYANNSHHPEHRPEGVAGMDLYDLVEMFCDWQAATLRHDDGDLKKSVEQNIERFEISEDLGQILLNTVARLKE